MAKKLKKAQRGGDPGFSQPGRNTNTPRNNDAGFAIPGRNTRPVNDPDFARPSKKDFIRGVAEGIVDSSKSKGKSIQDIIKDINKNKKREDYLEYYKKGGPITALDQVQRMYSKKKK